ncbi:MOSC domain-containing protein [Hyphococcus lacteus]|uniref:MOSC N-terminal beta barrel domain-containing protein n=1 Tax=Hyphococcus lacteus TaxID=3143536 RepID=A0ABV3Z782_9PROT
MRVTSLHIYPVKSGRSISLDQAHLRPRGLARDRRWIITDENNRFLTQRECGALARIIATPTDIGVTLSTDGGDAIDIAFPSTKVREAVVVWKDTVLALPAGTVADLWVSAIAGRPARLLFMDDDADRNTPGKWGAKTPVSFADGFPLLVTSTSSLSDLNNEITKGAGESVGMERFRPNIVIEGSDPWAEDYWSLLEIGDVTIELVKPCARCLVTTKDQRTGEVKGRAPLRTLGRIRRSTHPDLQGALFGWNAAVIKQGRINVGDSVKVLERRENGWPLA